MPEVEQQLPPMAGPGLVWIGSKIKRPDALDEPTFLKWYDEEALPQLVTLRAFRSATRATARDQSDEWQTLCIAAVDDFAFFQTEEFREGVPGDSKLLPGSGKYNDLVDFDCRFYSVRSSFEHSGQTTMENTRCLMVVGIDYRADVQEEDTNTTAHLPVLAKIPGFLRSSRYKLEHSLWTSGDGAALPCPDWMEVFEFDTPDVDLRFIAEESARQSSVELETAMAQTTFSMEMYNVEKTFGDKTLFHGLGPEKRKT